jgi:DNA-binding winged helix-turn-helix (wHTH) protein/tetratricopeptide (TPR) repeat protein/TolB-like protein
MAEAPDGGPRGPFRLGEWFVEPELGRISRGDEVVQLRPRAMEVLICLVELKGRLASKQHLIDTVWRTEFVSDNALTHIIAELRTELGDDAEKPTYIETIPRRGYRVIAPLTTLAAEIGNPQPFGGEDPIERAPDSEGMTTARATPTRISPLKWLAPAVALILAAIAIGLWLILGGQPAPAPEEASDVIPNRVVVAEFENRSGGPAFDNFGVQVADSITALLRQVARLTVATNPYRSGEPAGADLPRRLAEATRSGLVVTGACYARGDQVAIQARVVDPWRNEVKQSFDVVSALRSDPSPAVEDLSQQVAGTLALHFDNTIPLGVSRPVPLAAVQEYASAREHLRPPYDIARSRLERALEIDPDFHLVRGRLLRWHASSGRYREAEAELEVLERHLPEMTRHDRAWVRAWRAEYEGRPLDVLRALREVVELAPTSYWARYKLGLWAISNNRPREAVDVLSGIPFDWTSGTAAFVQQPFVNLCFAHHLLGDDEAVLRLAAESLEHFPDGLVFYGLQANILGVMGRFEEMNDILEKSLTIRWHTRTSPGVSSAYTARELRAHGYREQSLDLAERSVEWYRERPDEIQGEPWFYLAALNVAERWREARDVAGQKVRENPDDVQYFGFMGVLEARIGNTDGARRIAEKLLTSEEADPIAERLVRPERTYWRACIAAQLGECDEAVRLLQRSFAEGLRFSDEFHRDINLEPLWDFPPFQELIAPKG